MDQFMSRQVLVDICQGGNKKKSYSSFNLQQQLPWLSNFKEVELEMGNSAAVTVFSNSI